MANCDLRAVTVKPNATLELRRKEASKNKNDIPMTDSLDDRTGFSRITW